MSNIKLENLEIDGYHIYQDKTNFNFGIDAVLLANFALNQSGILNIKQKKYDKKSVDTENAKCTSELSIKICDFCSGTLPIPLIIYAKSNKSGNIEGDKVNTNTFEHSSTIHIDAFEIDKDQAELSEKSIQWNKENVSNAKSIDEDMTIYNDDIKNIFLDKGKYKSFYEMYDVVTVNPPYTKKGSGILNLTDKKIIARHEISVTFDDICRAANLILKSNKKFYFIHKSNRFTEIVSTLKKYSFALKKVAFIHPYVDKEANLFLAEAVKNAREDIKILEPVIIYEKPLVYTKKVLEIYGK